MQRSTLVLVQALAAVLVVLGAVAVVVGHQAQASQNCETRYYYDASAVPGDEVDGQVVAFENLSDSQQEAFLAAIDDASDGDAVSTEEPPSVVSYQDEFYEVLVTVNACGDPTGVWLTLVGVPVLVVGALGFLPSFAVLRLRDWD